MSAIRKSIAVSRVTFTARLAVSASRFLSHFLPGIERCLLASATIGWHRPRSPRRRRSLPQCTPPPHAQTPAGKYRCRGSARCEPARTPGEVHLHRAAQQPLRADGEHIAEDKHPAHEHRVDRRTAKVGVVGRQLGAHPGQVQHRTDLASSVVGRNGFIKAERIKQLSLISVEPPRHHPPPPSSPHRR